MYEGSAGRWDEVAKISLAELDQDRFLATLDGPDGLTYVGEDRGGAQQASGQRYDSLCLNEESLSGDVAGVPQKSG